MPFGQPPVPELPASLDISGKTAIVTGGNAGLGLAIARTLLQRGLSHLILAVRTPAKGEDAKGQLLADPTVAKRPTPPTIQVMPLDLSSHASVLAFANRVDREVPQLHIAVLNAGINAFDFELAPETKNEMSYQVNFLSNALLAVLLLPALQRTTAAGPTHLTLVGSRMALKHTLAKHPVSASQPVAAYFNDRASFDWTTRYGDSKYLALAFWHALAAHVDSTRVVVNAVCPGQLKTGLADGAPSWLTFLIIKPMLALRARSAEEGARCIVYGAVAAGKESHGKQLGDMNVEPLVPYAETPAGRALEERIWNETMEIAEGLSAGAPQKAGLA
ncbi:hypothetical protein BD626DRAFT_515617 [Schizophyllum amplum]|uniref:Uncharacterized protein n=1 Tax=Schizophyllum amplum TaxID=97359 RepID=A0A550BXM9_9AGAR|nr:hypothetical protein BD626DRAFT_515617 [Auriculariopsis ampla]